MVWYHVVRAQYSPQGNEKGPNKATGMESFLDEKIKKKDEEELSDKNVNDSSGEEEYLVIEQFKNSEAINDALRDIKFKKK